MQLIQTSIVILGNWNPRIFTPFWIKKKLFGLDDSDKIQAFTNFEDQNFGFQYNGITIIPQFHVLEIQINQIETTTFLLAAKMVHKIFELLPQTPIKAMGINIRYNLTSENNNSLHRKMKEVPNEFKDFKLNQISFKLEKENYTINLITEILGDTYVPVLNFHYKKIINLDSDFINNHIIEAEKILA
jgi:hypothetical protein